MRILHTSDWHLGRMLYGRSLLEDQAYFLQKILLPFIEKEDPDLLIIAGDIYDRQIAPIEAIQLFDEFLTAMAARKIPTAVIAGNHDSAERMALAKGILRQSGIYIAANLDDAKQPVLLTKNGERTQIFLLPFLDPAAVRDYFKDDSLRGEAACMARTLAMLQESFDETAQKVLVSHCFAAGAQTSDSESGLWVGGSGQIPPALWEAFDYVALGHLHRAQRAGKNGHYAGSPLKYSVDEQTHKKSFSMVTLENHAYQLQTIPIPALHDVRRLRGDFAELLTAGKQQPCEDYLEIELTDKNPVLLAAEQLRTYYPNLLAVTNPWVAEAASSKHTEHRRNQDDMTIFKSFLSEICGIEVTEAEEEWFLAAHQKLREELI